MIVSGAEEVSVLELILHGMKVGYLTGYKDGRNVLTFTPEFTGSSSRSTFTLTTHPDFLNVKNLLAKPWLKRQRLHPVLSKSVARRSIKRVAGATSENPY